MGVRVIVVMLVLAALVAPASYPRERIVSRPSYTVSLPVSGWPLSWVTAPTDAGGLFGVPLARVQWQVRLTTGSAEAYPWSDDGWMGAHRWEGGVFRVYAVRSNGKSYCVTQTFTIPAAPNQSVTYALDLSRYSETDALMFENWPGVSVEALPTVDGHPPAQTMKMTAVETRAIPQRLYLATDCR